MSRVRCLYCDAENDAVQSAGYCETCGKKLPPASLAHKRREPARHDPAGVAVPDEERRPRSQASGWLFTIAILQLIAAGLLLILAPFVRREPLPADFIPNVILYNGVLFVVLIALGWLTRSKV
jgi:hypothetical protein